MRTTIIALLLFLYLAETTTGQIRTSGITVRGTVTDPSGGVIANANLHLSSAGSLDEKSATTNASGRFQFDNILPGIYVLTTQYKGFRVATSQLSVGNEAPSPLMIRLTLETVESQVQVSSEEQGSLEPSANPEAIHIGGTFLSSLPVLDEDYVDTLLELLEPADTGTSGGTIIVDGMEVRDGIVSQAAIDEVRINQDPYSAEFWRPGKGRIEITTKSSTDKYHGSLGFSFRDATLDARNAFAEGPAPEQRRLYDAVLTGPVPNTKDGFLLSFTRSEDDVQSYVFATGAQGLIQQNVPSPSRTTIFLGRWTHALTNNHRISLQYNFFDETINNSGVGGVVLASAGTNNAERFDDVTFSDEYTFSPKKLNQLQVRLERFRNSIENLTNAPEIIVEGAFTSGGAQAASLNTQYVFTLNDTFSWTRGKHQIKAGINLPNWSRNAFDDHTEFGGVYNFSDLTHYLAAQPYLLTWQAGNPRFVYNYREVAGFFQDQMRLKPRLTFTVGLRYDWQSYVSSRIVAPRISLAYSLDKKAKTVIRAGAGIFDDRTGSFHIADPLRYNGTSLFNYFLSNPVFSPQPIETVGSQGLSDTVVLAPNVRLPYTTQYSLGIERKISTRSSISASYRGSRGDHLFRSFDLNAPPPPYTTAPDPNAGIIRQIQSESNQHYDGFDFTFRGDIGKFFSGQAQYTLSWNENNTGGILYFPSNMYDLSGEWARADFDRRHRVTFFGTFHAKQWFTASTVLRIASGQPFTITTGADNFNDALNNARPIGVPRNSLQGAASEILDLRIAHDFSLNRASKNERPTRKLSVAVDAFNILNHANFTSYEGVQSSPLFGLPLSSGPARRLQLSTHFQF